MIALIVGCTSQDAPPTVNRIETDNLNTIMISHDTGITDFLNMQKETRERRIDNQNTLREEKLINECIKKRTKNWRRIIDDKLIHGYDKEEDYDLRWRMRLALRNNEEIC